MVMHARKPARIGDGYFEKHQAHPYQNSKYNSKGGYDRDRMRDRDSPNGNSYRSESPECDSPRGSYHGKYVSSKSRDKERDRDYKTRDKYSDCLRSPKEKRMRESRESEHRTNHDRNSTEKNDLHSMKLNSQNASRESSQRKLNTCQDKRDDRERIVRVGDWSEHLSSSGKKYYYNCKTEVSQWEKPREWSDPRQNQARHSNYPPHANRTVLDKHSNSRTNASSNSSKTNMISASGQAARSDKIVNASGGYWPQSHHESSDSRKEISNSAGDSTPTSECSGTHGGIVQSSTVGVASSGGVGSSAIDLVANAPGPPGGPIAPIHVDTSCSNVQDPGPPTPTHSETQDCTDVRKLVSPPSSLSSLQNLAASSSLAAIRPQAPNLTPSLANHYRDDLVNHVRGWPADVLEKQAQKLGEEAHGLGAMCTRVSAELKCARSIVRLTEIQATLQEQRVLFLRQQIKNLEELKSQNSFMADEA